MLRGALVGFFVLPGYWLLSAPSLSPDVLFPAAAGAILLAALGVVGGYCWGNVEGYFDYSLPSRLTRPAGDSRPSGAPVQGDIADNFAFWPQPPSTSDTSSFRFDEDLKERMIISGDWRDEYSTPASRRDDDAAHN